jgi:hypothetical protein
MQVIEALLLVLKLWLAVGLVFGVAFVIGGVHRIDPAAVGSRWGFRLLILPGCLIWTSPTFVDTTVPQLGDPLNGSRASVRI